MTSVCMQYHGLLSLCALVQHSNAAESACGGAVYGMYITIHQSINLHCPA